MYSYNFFHIRFTLLHVVSYQEDLKITVYTFTGQNYIFYSQSCTQCTTVHKSIYIKFHLLCEKAVVWVFATMLVKEGRQ
jgi:hypothetical protein